MTEIKDELSTLRQTMASVISTIEVTNTIPVVCHELGLPDLWDNEGISKFNVVSRMLNAASDIVVLKAAKQMLIAYPGRRGKPQDKERQIIQDAIWWIENDGHQYISNVVRFEIAERLELFAFWGRSDNLQDFFLRPKFTLKTMLVFLLVVMANFTKTHQKFLISVISLTFLDPENPKK